MKVVVANAPDEKMLCYCRNVRYGEVRRCIEEGDLTRIDQVMKACNAGTGCRSCHPEIQGLLEARRPKRTLGSLLRSWLRR